MKRGGENAVFGHAVQHAVGANDRGVLRSCQNQHADHDHEAMEQQPRPDGARQVHGDSTDEVGKVVGPHLVWNHHDRKERDQRREQHAVDEDHKPGFFQVLELWVFDFPVDLRQRFFAAHGQHGVPEADEQEDPGQVTEECAVQPAQRFLVDRDDAWGQGAWWERRRVTQNCKHAPGDQDHDHDGGHDHDLQCFSARLVDTLDVLPPEIDHHKDGKHRREAVLGKGGKRMSRVPANVLDQARQVLAGGNRADGAGQHIVEKQRGNGNLGQRPAHRLLDHAVHAAAREHAARLDIKSTDGIAEQHDRENEPGGALADDFFGIAAGIVGGRSEIGKDNGRCAPEGNERQHHRGGDKHLDGGALQTLGRWRRHEV